MPRCNIALRKWWPAYIDRFIKAPAPDDVEENQNNEVLNNEGSFLNAIRPGIPIYFFSQIVSTIFVKSITRFPFTVLVAYQFFGQLPIANIWSVDPNQLAFRWLSWRVLLCTFVLFCTLMLAALWAYSQRPGIDGLGN